MRSMSSALVKLVALVLGLAVCSMLLVDACPFCFGSKGRVQTELAAASPRTTRNRKVLADTLHGIRSRGRTASSSSYRWNLREVPLGPDPLHHNGGTPKKPRIT